MNIQKNTYYLFALTFILCTTSCKKTVENWIDQPADTVYTSVSKLSANRIIEYKVQNAGSESIYSSIDDESKTITVYLPHYYELSFLETQITLPEGATVSPGEDVLVPVFANVPFKYTVTDQKNNKAEYEVKIVIQQPNLWLTDFSSETTTTVLRTSSGINIKGGNLIPTYNITKLYLTDKDGKRIYSEFRPFTNGTERSNGMSWRWGLDILTNEKVQGGTDYWLEIESYSISRRMKYPIRVNK